MAKNIIYFKSLNFVQCRKARRLLNFSHGEQRIKASILNVVCIAITFKLYGLGMVNVYSVAKIRICLFKFKTAVRIFWSQGRQAINIQYCKI